MKRLIYFALFVTSSFTQSRSGRPDPVRWSFRVTPSAAGIRIVYLSARIDPGWHIYAQVQPKEAISQPTTIHFRANPLIHIQGRLIESGTKETYTDKTAGIRQYYFADSAVYSQAVSVSGRAKVTLAGTITYQACTAEMCLLPKTISFEVFL